MPSLQKLPDAPDFKKFSYLELNDRGAFVRDGKTVPVKGLSEFFAERLVIRDDVTDVFVWVHGWRNDKAAALKTGKRLFNGIITQHARDAKRYPNLMPFVPAFVLVHWPSESSFFPSGYRKIRDRARKLTEEGAAEFFLASLLGYLNHDRAEAKTLKGSRGFRIHCVGHSFGGRFLTAAIGAAATPEAPATLKLLAEMGGEERKTLSAGGGGFQFTVDSLTVFQMAAPSSSFEQQLLKLVDAAPLRGPVVLTYSKHDRANCFFHKIGENGERAIGCEGVIKPANRVHTIEYRPLDQDYPKSDFTRATITNVNAGWAFTAGGPTGAHSDFWWVESIHLLLSAVNYS